MYPEKPNLVEPSKISNGSYAAGIVLSEEMQQTLNQTQCGAVPSTFVVHIPLLFFSLSDSGLFQEGSD
jgi:hypothetical protein